MSKTKIACRSHTGLPALVIEQMGESGFFRIDFREKTGFDTTFPTADQAKAEADLRVAKAGHVCDQKCSLWNDVDPSGGQKVVVYRTPEGKYAVIDVPDAYTSGDLRPAPRSSDSSYADKASAVADARARCDGQAIVLDESELN
jgi:hypothetical protein